MGIMSKYNKGGVTFDIDIKNFKFVTLEDLFKANGNKMIYGVDGLYINTKSSFGEHPVAIVASEEFLVDLPSHMTDDVKEILKDQEAIEAIKAGRVGFVIQEYFQKQFKKTCYGIMWEDL